MRGAPADDRPDLDGSPVEGAADIVVEDAENAAEVRETLAIVARDGVVRRAAVDDALANASKVVTTAETRTELAAEKLDGARETAAPISDLRLVSARLDDFDARFDAIETRADDLGDAIQDVLGMKADGDLYEIARRIRRLTTAATDVQRAADDVQFELDSFEAWLTDADRRVEELTSDVDALDESVAELGDVVEGLPAADGDPESEAAVRWATATVRHRVASLMIADLRAELEALRTWAEREGESPPANVEPRLDDIQARNEAVMERLTARADPEWIARFDDRVTALDDALDDLKPPVVWGAVEAVVAEHRPAHE
jgi:archaellum component FlaC